MSLKGRTTKTRGRAVANIPGTIRAIDTGNGMCELRKDIDVLTIIPQKKRRSEKLIWTLGSIGIFGGAAAALILLAPAFSTILMAVVAWLMFAVASGAE